MLAATLVTNIASAQSLVKPDYCNLLGPTITTSTWRSTAGRFQLAYDSSNFTSAGVTDLRRSRMRAAFLAHPGARSEDRRRNLIRRGGGGSCHEVIPKMSIRSLTIALALLPIGCTSTSYEVIHCVDPSPYSKTSTFSIKPIRYVDLKVDGRPEVDYIASQKFDERADKWDVIKASIEERFGKKLAAELGVVPGAASATNGVFSIEPSVDRIETGFYRSGTRKDVARIDMTLRVVDTGGQVVDEIRLSDRQGFDEMFATANLRLTKVAGELAALAAEHIVERAASER